MAKGKLTRNQALSAVERLEAAVQEWQDTEDQQQYRPFRNQMVKPLSLGIEQAASDLFEVCDTCEAERDAWPLILAVDELDDAMTAFAERMTIAPQDTDPGGTRQLWGAYQRLLDAKVLPENRKPEPIKQLVDENVSRFQIAKIYGWYLSDGRTPDVGKVQEELEKPGTHFDMKHWQHPAYRRFWRQIEGRWQQRVAGFGRRQEEESQARAKREAPESIEELLALPNISARQIAKMKGITEEEVHQAAADYGFALDSETLGHRTYRDAQMAREKRQQERSQRSMDLQELNTYEELGDDLDSRIELMLGEGVQPRDIADAIRLTTPSFSIARVVEVRNRLREEEKIRRQEKQRQPSEKSQTP